MTGYPPSPLARLQPTGRTPEERIEATARQALREHGMLVIRLDDPRLHWPEREMLRQVAGRIFGWRAA